MWEELRLNKDYEIYTEYPYEIRRKSDNKTISEWNNGNGYKRVCIGGRGELKHRIVAIQWIANPNNLPEVDHINKIRDDNRKENLRWVSLSDNSKNVTARRNVVYNYIEHMTDQMTEINHYSNWDFDNLYFDLETELFYFYNGIYYRELHINEPPNGNLYVYVYDVDNKLRKIYYNKFRKENDFE